VPDRLTRRSLFACAAVVLAAAGCTPANGANASPSPTTDPPPDGEPLASWALSGGFTMAGLIALRPPRLVVYGDGATIADAAYKSRIDADDLKRLVDQLVKDLRDPTPAKTGTGQTITDAPTTEMKAWDGRSMLSASAYGLDELRDEDIYDAALYDARDRMGDLYKKVISTAQPFLGARVRVVTEVVSAAPAPTDVTPWPAQVALPVGTTPVGRTDFDGQQARDAVRLLTRDLDQRGAWPTYKTASGQLVQASWRYLLPGE
jgi:hypothetical protein